MNLRIYNSLSRQKEEFVPLVDGEVKMYVCGVTVYDLCHLGHARAYVVWDTVRRYLSRHYQVTYVQNITDIDDKILNRAQEHSLTMQQVSDRFIQEYAIDMEKLNILPADHSPRATAYIPQIISMTEAIQAQGYAYFAQGDVYYAVERFKSYGKLSGRKLSDLQAGASGRVEDDGSKSCPFDFALWKGAKPGEPAWDSPWGRGRPGWHIECSAMVRAVLGDQIDIHAGGADLQFPHHENEIAQSEVVTGKPLANYWMHNGFVNIENAVGEVEKMSKSLNNFKTIRSLLEIYSPMVIRLFILQSHYRQPISFSESAIAATSKGWETINQALLFRQDFGESLGWKNFAPKSESELQSSCAEFEQGMADDFNSPVALAVIFQIAKTLRAERNNLKNGAALKRSPQDLWQAWQELKYMCDTLGLVGYEAAQTGHPALVNIVASTGRVSSSPADQTQKIETMIEQRLAAKQAKNYAEADRIRQQLSEMGVIITDRKDGSTQWQLGTLPR
ncbi:MAG: cysteine--tRNA ligase [Pseudanabaenaceae cyanobacterium bins.68]|nr:cysteine--tRNA ligase [Pseudanabaenaceae cyanobacterium bins.68]